MKQWEDFLKREEETLGKEIAAKWLHTLKVVNFDAGNLYLEALNPFHIHWFEEHLRGTILKHLRNVNQRPIKVHLTLPEGSSLKKQKTKETVLEKTPSFELESDPLDPYALLENFVPTATNTIPYTLLCELVKAETPPFNPVFLYGKPGTGKTHLLMAIAQAYKKKGVNVAYVRAETFTEHLVKAIRIGKMDEFRKSYRKVDVLLIDDVHLFARRTATQEEFFHTFNNLHGDKKQLVFTSNTSPQYLTDIEPRLVSRFEWGITLQLEKASPLEQKQILLKRAETLQFPLTEELAAFLLNTFKTTKTLQKALETLVLRTHLEGNQTTTKIDLKKAYFFLKDLIEEEGKTALNSEKIIHAVSHLYGLRTTELLGKSQSQECSIPRQIAMYLCRKELHMPFLKIGQLFFRDHSTVMTSIKHVAKKIEDSDAETLTSLQNIYQQLEKSSS